MKNVALFEDRVADLEKRVKELLARDPENTIPVTGNETSIVQVVDDEERREERESARREFGQIGCSAPIADKLYDHGVTSLQDLADTNPSLLRGSIPTIDLFIDKARRRYKKPPLSPSNQVEAV